MTFTGIQLSWNSFHKVGKIKDYEISWAAVCYWTGISDYVISIDDVEYRRISLFTCQKFDVKACRDEIGQSKLKPVVLVYIGWIQTLSREIIQVKLRVEVPLL